MQVLIGVFTNLKVPCYVTCINPCVIGYTETTKAGVDKVYKVIEIGKEGYVHLLAPNENSPARNVVVRTSMLDYFRVAYKNEIKKVVVEPL